MFWLHFDSMTDMSPAFKWAGPQQFKMLQFILEGDLTTITATTNTTTTSNNNNKHSGNTMVLWLAVDCHFWGQSVYSLNVLP